MSSITDSASPDRASRTPRQFAVRHPIRSFLLLAYPLGWILFVAGAVAGLPADAAIVVANLVGILGPAVLITYWIGGAAGVRRLFSGVLRWRIGIGRYLLVVGAVPILTLLLMAVTGTFGQMGSWSHILVTYLVAFLLTALTTNLWEEVAWSGFVQSRVLARRGVLTSAVVTAPLFVAQHLPMLVVNSGGMVDFLVAAGFLVGMALVFRYLIAVVLIDTVGSLLAVGLLHASTDASGTLASGHGGWQQFVAVVPLTVLVIGYRALRRRRAFGPAPDLALIPERVVAVAAVPVPFAPDQAPAAS
jgi:hypothetical protein